MSLENFILKANLKHNYKYNYNNVVYKNNKTKIEIICPIHDVFLQRAAAHLDGQGCRQCSIAQSYFNQVKDINWFIQKANLIHNNFYDYSKSIYVRIKNKIEIVCPFHGSFIQAAYAHLKGQGCPACKCIGTSIIECKWLDSFKLPSLLRQFKINIGNFYYKVDGYDPATNTIYEFYGDYWHGNPQKFNLNNLNIVKNKTFFELYNETIEKETKLKAAGYNIISIWENDYINQ